MIDLKPFCSTDKDRPYLHKPFSRGGYTYATNGHVLVRVARLPEFSEQEKPDPAFLFATYFKEVPRGAVEVSLPETKADADCDLCDGRGTEHGCPDCECPCVRCDGTGKREEVTAIGIGKAAYNAKYIRKLLRLPGLKFDASPPSDAAGSFTFDGGDGLLMPMQWSEPKIMASVQIGLAQRPSNPHPTKEEIT